MILIVILRIPTGRGTKNLGRGWPSAPSLDSLNPTPPDSPLCSESFMRLPRAPLRMKIALTLTTTPPYAPPRRPSGSSLQRLFSSNDIRQIHIEMVLGCKRADGQDGASVMIYSSYQHSTYQMSDDFGVFCASVTCWDRC